MDKSAALVADISRASREQSDSIQQIKQAIGQVNAVVQTNTATAEESAASSEELSAQAELMKEQVRRFKLRESNSAAFSQPDAPYSLPSSQSEQSVTASLGSDKY